MVVYYKEVIAKPPDHPVFFVEAGQKTGRKNGQKVI